jgi:hypothetical protein
VIERPAVEGELLLTYRFRNGIIGLAAPSEIGGAKPQRTRRSPWSACLRVLEQFLRQDSTPLVRVRHGTLLRINYVPDEIALEFGVNPIQEVRFVRLDAPACIHRDALRFYHGRHVLLQRFQEGVTFQVLTNGSDDQVSNEGPSETLRLIEPCPTAIRE